MMRSATSGSELARPESAIGGAEPSTEKQETLMSWTKPEALEIKMDAEISSYQDDDYDPYKDGPLFVEQARPRETDLENRIPRA
jgi:hypothetical protein